MDAWEKALRLLATDVHRTSLKCVEALNSRCGALRGGSQGCCAFTRRGGSPRTSHFLSHG